MGDFINWWTPRCFHMSMRRIARNYADHFLAELLGLNPETLPISAPLLRCRVDVKFLDDEDRERFKCRDS